MGLLVALVALCTDLAVEFLGRVFLHLCPRLVFPHFQLGIYQNATEALDPNQQRTIYTNSQNVGFLCWWSLALGVALVRRDRTTWILGLMLGLGFGTGFPLSACWCLGYADVHSRLDYWKVWELSAGFILGVVYSIALGWAQDRVVAERASSVSGPLLPSAALWQGSEGRTAASVLKQQQERWRSACSVPTVCLIVFLAYADGNPLGIQTGVFLSLFYIAVLGYCSLRRGSLVQPAHSRANGSLVYSVFLLVFVLLRGASTRIGLVLGLYDKAAVDQYAWPLQRRWLFGPTAAALVATALVSLRHGNGLPATSTSTADIRLIGVRGNSLTESTAVLHNRESARQRPCLCLRQQSTCQAASEGIDWSAVAGLVTLLGVVGAVTIWPEKIGILYAIAMHVAVFALGRINLACEARDGEGQEPPSDGRVQ